METERLRYFCSIVDSGSLTKAAEVLGISHSGLSKAMSVLQDELGFKVFSPKGRGLELTDKGKNLYEQSRQVLELMNSIKSQTTAPTQSLRISFPEALALAVTGRIAEELKEPITIENLDSGEMEVQILDRKIDFGFTFVPFPHKELDHLKIASVCISSHARIGFFHKHLPEAIPYVVPSHEMKDNPLSIKARDGWNSKIPRYTPFKANSLSIALRMVQSGSCAIYSPDFIFQEINKSLQKDQQIIELELDPRRKSQEKTHRDIFLIKRSHDEETKPMKTLVKIVRQICKKI